MFYNTCCGLNKSNVQRGVKRRLGQDEHILNSMHSLMAQQEQIISGTSLKEAVKFAKRNNLLGIISEATPLVKKAALTMEDRLTLFLF